MRLAALGNIECGLQRIRPFTEQGHHLLRRPKGIFGVAAQKAIRLTKRHTMTNAREDVVQRGFICHEVMHIPCGHQTQVQPMTEGRQPGIQTAITAFMMALKLEGEVLAPEDIGVFGSCGLGSLRLAFHDYHKQRNVGNKPDGQ